MAPQPVEAVWFFRWNTQVSQATYNRISASTKYTKNYIQVSGEPGDVLDEMFKRVGEAKVDLTWKWPGGEQTGQLRLHRGEAGKAKRVQLVWMQGGKAPATWKLGDPTVDSLITMEGDPSQTTAAGADDALRDALDQDTGPWLIAVKLIDEDDVLHARAFLERPPTGMEHASIEVLPSGLLAAIKQLDDGSQSGWHRPVGSPAPKPRAAKLVEQILGELDQDPNVLLVGPPGTGKTVALEDLRAIVEHADSPLTFDPDLIHDAFASAGNAGKVISLVFHPSYSYEDFVAGLLPESDGTNLRLVARPGPLVSLAHWAGADPERRALMILDEFNRGPTAAIFGDTLALLDASKRHGAEQSGAHITRPFPNQQMQVAAEFSGADGSRDVPPELRLPANVQIVAALNSSDRSVAPLDAALRRRFAILAVPPDLDVFASHLGVDVPGDTFALADDPDQWTPDEVRQLAILLLKTLNERIAFVLSEDFLLGHALLWPVGDAIAGDVHQVLCSAFDNRIVQSLRLTFTDQDELLAAVLGAGVPEDDVQGDRIAHWRNPSEELAAVASPRLALRSLGSMDWAQAGAALRAVLG
jgi:5-methylcytosine-specific restriction protein B